MSLRAIKIGTEEYVPALPANKRILQEVSPRHWVINFSDYVAIPYSRSSSKAYVRVEVQDTYGKYSYVVDSAKLAQALRLPNTQEVHELAKQSKLVQKIQEVTNTVEKEKRALFKQIFKRFYSVYSISDEVRKTFGDNVLDLTAMIKDAVAKLYRSSLPEYNDQVHYHVIQKDKKKNLVIVLKEQNGLRVVCLEKYIAAGTYAGVLKVKSILDRVDLALKVAKPNDEAQQKLDKEFEAYRQLYGNQPPGSHITGLQMNCYRKLDNLPLRIEEPDVMVDPQNLTRGLLMPFYCFGNLCSFVKEPSTLNLTHLEKGWKEDGCYQLLLGARYLETLGKVDVDTCLDNTLITKSKEKGFLQFDLGDLEGIISFKDYRKSRSLSHHSEYIRLSEVSLMLKCLGDHELFKQEMEKVAPKAATFALTTTLIVLLTQQFSSPYYLQSDGKNLFPYLSSEKPKKVWDVLEKENKELASLFEYVLYIDYRFRHTPKQLLERFHTIMKVHNPQLHQKYDQQVKALLQSKPKESVEEKGKESDRPMT